MTKLIRIKTFRCHVLESNQSYLWVGLFIKGRQRALLCHTFKV